MSRSAAALVGVVILASWLGAAAFFSAVVAPAVFAELPTRTLAGAVVGRVLPMLFYAGMVVGLATVALSLSAYGTWRPFGAETAGAVIVAACVVAQLFVGRRLERLRADIGGPLEMLSLADPRRVAFGRLHGASVAWLGLAMLAAAAGIVVLVRTISRARDGAL